jgi:hypothetical protein
MKKTCYLLFVCVMSVLTSTAFSQNVVSSTGVFITSGSGTPASLQTYGGSSKLILTFGGSGVNGLEFSHPSAPRMLVKSGGAAVGAALELGGNNNTVPGVFETTGTLVRVGSKHTTGNFALFANNLDALTISPAGYIGVGAAPSSGTGPKLLVSGNIQGTQVWSGGVFNSTATTLSLATAGTTRATVTSTGLGIGTAAPAEALQVVGNTQLGGGLIFEGGANPTIYTGASAGTTELARYVRITNTASQSTPAGLKAGGLLVSDDFTYASPAKNDMVVKGKVFIGTPNVTTTTTTYLLAVNGKIGTKDVQIETTSDAWPDYVFESDYKLMAVNEIAKYIREHKHLPGIPSAQEVARNGYSVSDLDVQLLKKVEELTLYIIEQQKQIDALKKMIEEKK